MVHYLDWHQNTWRVRIVVPERLRDKIGKKVFLWETGESEFNRAKRAGAPAIKRFLAQIAKADGRRPGSRFLRDSRAETRSVEWFTPPRIFEAMPGVMFDQDVASPGAETVWWIPAHEHITEKSLGRAWRGLVWMNVPFGVRAGLRDWLDKFLQHGNGVAILPSNSYTKWWHHIADRADAILFIRGYVQFFSPAGPVRTRACFGSNMFAVGIRGVDALRLAAANGLGTVVVKGDTETGIPAAIRAREKVP